MIRQLIALGALDVDTEGHGGLFLVQDKARPILRGETKVMLREEGKRRGEPQPTRARHAAAPACRRRGTGLFEALRAWRAAEAKAQRFRLT